MAMLHVSSSPHARNHTTTAIIMRDVLIALLPAAIFGVIYFGLNALLVTIASVTTAVVTEYIYEKAMKLPITTGDYSAAVTGLLIAMNMPPEIPFWVPMLGSVFAIVFVKMLFGGIGQNFMNPALAARCFLMISFAGMMTKFPVDAVTGATPLAVLKTGGDVDLLASFLGTIPGTIGETSVVALVLGAAYLVVRRVISLRIPLTYILTFAVFTLLFGGRGFDLTFLAAEICCGGLILGAFFMATDYVTSPITPMGQIVFGIALGIMTGLFRFQGNSAEGVSFAIIFCNLLVPLIEKVTLPKAFGREGRQNGKK